MHNLSDVEGSKNACHHDQDEDMGCHRRGTRLLSRLGLGVFRPDRDEDFEASVKESEATAIEVLKDYRRLNLGL